MIIPNQALISLLAHKDKVVRERIAYNFLNNINHVNDCDKNEILEKALCAITSFGIENNGFMLDFLAKFIFTSKQLRIFCSEVEKKNFLPKGGKRLFTKTTLETQIERGIEKILLFQEPETLFSMRFNFSNVFFEKYYVQKKKETFPDDLKKAVCHSTGSEIWVFLKSKFIENSRTDALDTAYGKLMLQLLEQKFSNNERQEIKNFFDELANGGKLNINAAFFYLRCIEILKLKDLADEAFVLLTVSSSKQLYLKTVEVLALFKSKDYAKKIFELYKKKNNTPTLKSALIAFFSLSCSSYEEQLLMKLAAIEKNKRRQLEIAIALSSIFSTQFIPYALSLLEQNGDYHFFDLEEEILVFSLISDRKITENSVFRVFASNYFRKRASRSFQPRLPFFIRKNLKQLWQDSR